jgi:hypothetical protein
VSQSRSRAHKGTGGRTRSGPGRLFELGVEDLRGPTQGQEGGARVVGRGDRSKSGAGGRPAPGAGGGRLLCHRRSRSLRFWQGQGGARALGRGDCSNWELKISAGSRRGRRGAHAQWAGEIVRNQGQGGDLRQGQGGGDFCVTGAAAASGLGKWRPSCPGRIPLPWLMPWMGQKKLGRRY